MTSSIPELSIGGVTIEPGERQVIDVPVAPMYTHDDLSITVQVVRGKHRARHYSLAPPYMETKSTA